MSLSTSLSSLSMASAMASSIIFLAFLYFFLSFMARRYFLTPSAWISLMLGACFYCISLMACPVSATACCRDEKMATSGFWVLLPLPLPLEEMLEEMPEMPGHSTTMASSCTSSRPTYKEAHTNSAATRLPGICATASLTFKYKRIIIISKINGYMIMLQ